MRARLPMIDRVAIGRVAIGGVAIAMAAGIGIWWTTGIWWMTGPAAPLPVVEALPIPPFPPRIAQGDRYERCLWLLAEDPAAALALASSWLAEGGGDGALHCRGLALVGDGQAGTGVAQLEQLALTSAAPPLARASILGQAAQIRLMADQPQQALQDATQALMLSPGDVELLVTRAAAATALDRLELAILDLSRALTLNPTRRDAWVMRARVWRLQNRLDLAGADVDRAMSLDPEDAEALLERGILRQQRGDRAGARADWQHVRAIDPNGTAADLAEQNLALLDAGPNQR